MTPIDDVIERLEAGLTELVNQLRSSIDESTPPRLVEWLTLDAQRAEALLPIVAEAASLIKTLREERDEMHSGKRAVLPQTKEHAESLYTVAVAGLKTYGVDAERSLVETEREECANLIEEIAAAWKARPPMPRSNGEWPMEMARAIRARATPETP